MTEFTGTGFDAVPLTREFCDASAVQSEYAANVVTMPYGQLYLCGHHTYCHGAALMALGGTVEPLPDIYALSDDVPATDDVMALANAVQDNGNPPMTNA